MTERSETLSGSDVDGYRIDFLVGRGGMGAVYRARDLQLGRTVALKVLAPELARNDGFRERFLRESRLAALLDPHIVPIFHAGETDGLLLLAMRYVEGSDLPRLAEAGPLDPGRVVALVGQAASALAAAHEQGLVHRDVKPSRGGRCGARRDGQGRLDRRSRPGCGSDRARLVGELRMFRVPVVGGGGTPFLPPVTEVVPLGLVETRTFGSRIGRRPTAPPRRRRPCSRS